MGRAYLAIVALLLVAPAACYGQDVGMIAIRIRLLDYKTGRPMKGRHIQLTLFNHQQQDVIGRTGRDGVAVFWLNQPLPRNVDVVTLSDYPCTDLEVFLTVTVIQHGVVGDHADIKWCQPHTSQHAIAEPGEIIFYARHLNLWQRFRLEQQE